MTVTRPDGVSTILQDGDSIYLVGRGASPEGSRPFLDKMDLKTAEKTRLFQCGERTFESVLGFVGDSRSTIVISHETKTEPPNYFTVDLETGKRTKLTDFRDPAPQLTGLKKELIKYQRDDGVPLSGTLYLPPGYKEGTRLPLIIWAYPLEYSDAATAGQVRTSPYTFTRLAGPSQLFFVTQGYAVLDDATMPVVGDPETMNDTYVEQISAAARAAIETLDKKGVIDPKRVGVGGHSYGAFMTANLLAHTDLFAAGIARSGAYNRSLTPFGFQTERRSYWEATDLYTKMSPFTYANKINEPILLIHGEADNNSGTFPIQSERLFQAIKGNGGTARLVLLPHESHGYRARESVLHVLAEMFDWADRYVKNRPDSSGSSAPAAKRAGAAPPASGRSVVLRRTSWPVRWRSSVRSKRTSSYSIRFITALKVRSRLPGVSQVRTDGTDWNEFARSAGAPGSAHRLRWCGDREVLTAKTFLLREPMVYYSAGTPSDDEPSCIDLSLDVRPPGRSGEPGPGIYPTYAELTPAQHTNTSNGYRKAELTQSSTLVTPSSSCAASNGDSCSSAPS